MEMELSLTASVFMLTLIFAAWQGSARAFVAIRRATLRVSASPGIAALLLAACAIIAYAIPTLLGHTPAPVIHDEFAYLLAGDTFASGRLSNPSHPMARFFETFHVIQAPTYAAKFPPGLGLTLALGYVLGLPIIGVWITLALAAVAIYWMLLAVVPRRWALLAATLAAVHPTVIWFSQTYWGGGLSVLGGALLCGSMLRLATMRDFSIAKFASLGVIAGAGVGTLILSRPFEGMLTTMACGVAILAITFRRGIPLSSLCRYIAAASVLPILVVSWMLYYDWRVTGQPLVMPYVLHTARYMIAPLFFWQSLPATPIYPNDQMRQFHTVTEYVEYANAVGWQGYWLGLLNRGGLIAWAYLRPMLLVIPLCAAVFAYRNRSRRRILLACLLISAFVLLTHLLICPWMRIAYMAPLLGLVIVVITIGLRQIEAWRVNGQSVGRPMVRAIVVTQLVMGGYSLWFAVHQNDRAQISQRKEIIENLQQQGGEHLILVRYAPKYSPMQEWVYNGANVDQSKVIFARELGESADQELLDYYPHRKTWLLEVDRNKIQLRALEATASMQE